MVIVRGPCDLPDAVHRIMGDVTEPSTHRTVADYFSSGPLDLLVNNAGTYAGAHRIEETDVQTMFEMVAVHAAAPLAITKAVLPALRRGGGRSRVVNISSRLGSLVAAADRRFQHLEQSIEYRVGKAAMNMVTLACAEVLSDEAIEVCSVHPGSLRTPMGASDALTKPGDAARRLVDTLEDRERIGGRFLDLFGESDLPW